MRLPEFHEQRHDKDYCDKRKHQPSDDTRGKRKPERFFLGIGKEWYQAHNGGRYRQENGDNFVVVSPDKLLYRPIETIMV